MVELEISKEKDMPLLSRKRITALAKFSKQATPSNESIKKELAKMLKVDESLIAIRHIYQRFGSGFAKIIAHIYKDVKDLNALEEVKKKKFKKAKPKVEAPQEKVEEAEKKEKKEVKGEEVGKEKSEEQKSE